MRLAKWFIVLTVFLSAPCAFSQPYSHGPRYAGEEVLEELLIGRKTLIIKVASGGCTGKSSYRIDVKKADGITPLAPHYILTIHRVRIDECKAIIDDGPVILWDFEKDLGLKGNFTVSVRNMVDGVPPPYETGDKENSMLSTVRKHVDIEGSKRKEVLPKEQEGKRKL